MPTQRHITWPRLTGLPLRYQRPRNLVTGCGFVPDRNVTLRITRAGEDIGHYLTYVTDGDGFLNGELTNSATGALYIAVTDHRPDPGDAWGRLQSNAGILAAADAQPAHDNRAAMLPAGRNRRPHRPSGPLTGPSTCRLPRCGYQNGGAYWDR